MRPSGQRFQRGLVANHHAHPPGDHDRRDVLLVGPAVAEPEPVRGDLVHEAWAVVDRMSDEDQVVGLGWAAPVDQVTALNTPEYPPIALRFFHEEEIEFVATAASAVPGVAQSSECRDGIIRATVRRSAGGYDPLRDAVLALGRSLRILRRAFCVSVPRRIGREVVTVRRGVVNERIGGQPAADAGLRGLRHPIRSARRPVA